MEPHKSILFQVTNDDIPYIPLLKPIVQGRAAVHLNNQKPTMVLEVVARAKAKGATAVCTTSPELLTLLLKSPKELSIDKYAGSMITAYGLEFLILDPVSSLVKVSYGRFVYERYLSKFLDPSSWMQVPGFSWSLFEPAQAEYLLSLFSSASFISADIETGPEEERIITCISFTAVHIDTRSRSFTSTVIVVPYTDLYNVAFAGTILRLPVSKVFQNGKYDNAYLLRYGQATSNWDADTAHMFHAWYSELPKDLGFIITWLIRDWVYHKDESGTQDLQKYYEYNAKDSFTTAMSWLALLLEAPPFAWENYLQEFPLVYPCLLSEMTGIKIDLAKKEELRLRTAQVMDKELEAIRVMVDNPNYNPSSPLQTSKLFKILGCEDVLGTGKIPMDKAMARHPLNERILKRVKIYREERKLFSSYVGKDITWKDRLLYSLNPHGTDTFRQASKESAFWCGIQIQNIPRDKPEIQIKDMFISDPDFLFGEGDYAQNETWGTAFMSGDQKLIETISDRSKDFHGINASAFFGVPYEEIVKSSWLQEEAEWLHETLDKALRDLSKRTNHGTNYNMTAQVLLDTMGIKNVMRAKRLLGLPEHMTLKQVCQYLLNKFDETYPIVRGENYTWIKNEVKGSGLLVSPPVNGLRWTRKCFGDPSKNKHDMNAYAAHRPQNLAAVALNYAYRRVFYDVWLPNKSDFKLGPQIHDSIVFQYRIDREDLPFKVKSCMEFEIPVTDIFGTVRILQVPVDLKGNASTWSGVKKFVRAPIQVVA